jgi:hypothetical protein
VIACPKTPNAPPIHGRGRVPVRGEEATARRLFRRRRIGAATCTGGLEGTPRRADVEAYRDWRDNYLAWLAAGTRARGGGVLVG